jgi:outer membrane protein TolC
MTTILNVSQAYYKLVQDYNTLRVDQLSLTEVTRTLHASMLRIKAGKLAATEVVQQQAQSANLKTNLVRDKNILLQDYRAFLILLGLDPRSNLQIDRAIKIDNQPIPCPDEAIKIALCKNIEFKRSLAALKQLELALILAKDEQRWKLDLIARGQQAIIRNRRFATVSFDQLDAIGNDTPGAGTVVVNLNVPIHDLSRKQNLVRARIALQQAKIALETQRQQLIASVLNSIQTLQTQREQLKLSSEAATYSRQSLYIAQRKFEFGRTTMFEVTSLQTSLVTQEIAFISEQISYLNNFAAFEKLLGISLDKWCV